MVGPLAEQGRRCLAHHEQLYLFAKGVNDDRIYVNSAREGYPFDGWTEVQGGRTTTAAAAAAAFGERLYVFATTPDPSFWEVDWSPIEWAPFSVSRQADGIHFRGKLSHNGGLIERKFGAVWRLELHADRIPPSPTGRYTSNPNVQLSGRLLGAVGGGDLFSGDRWSKCWMMTRRSVPKRVWPARTCPEDACREHVLAGIDFPREKRCR